MLNFLFYNVFSRGKDIVLTFWRGRSHPSRGAYLGIFKLEFLGFFLLRGEFSLFWGGFRGFHFFLFIDFHFILLVGGAFFIRLV